MPPPFLYSGTARHRTGASTMATTERRLMTAEELWELPDDGQRRELVRGELRTMSPPSGEHGLVQLEFGAPLRDYVRAHDLGRVFGEAGFRLTEQPDTVRAPDVAFVA